LPVAELHRIFTSRYTSDQSCMEIAENIHELASSCEFPITRKMAMTTAFVIALPNER
jgi:hypothetical protein